MRAAPQQVFNSPTRSSIPARLKESSLCLVREGSTSSIQVKKSLLQELGCVNGKECDVQGVVRNEAGKPGKGVLHTRAVCTSQSTHPGILNAMTCVFFTLF